MIGNSSNSVSQTECPRSVDDDLARLYVAGRLSEEAAEEFEQHFFECDACAAEVERAMEIRAALKTRRVAGGGWRVGLAIAATLAAVALGLWQMQLREANLAPPPLRGASRDITATGRMAGATFHASWNAIRDARSYRVQVYNAIGEPVTWTETSATRFSANLGVPRNGEQRYWKVQALDEDHVVIASSPLMKIASS
jgi:DNA-binding beta-propeller fold protein YncE